MRTFSRTATNLCLAATLLILLPALAGSGTHAATLYGAAFNGADGLATLYTINPLTGAALAVGPIGFQRVGGMDFAPDGRLLGVGERNDGSNTVVLIVIDLATGAGTEIGATGLAAGTAVSDISFRPSDGRIYAYLEGPDRTATIDPATGAAAVLGASGLAGRGDGIAFTSGNALLLVETDNVTLTSTLYRLNQTTGAATAITGMTYNGFPAVVNSLRVNAMDIEPLSGQTIVSVANGVGGAGPNHLGSLNTGTGSVTYIGDTVAGLDALAWQPDHCPVTLYGSAYNGPNGPATLYPLDPDTGAPGVGAPIGFERVSGIDFCPDGILYGVAERTDGSDTSVLIRINPGTGVGTEIGPTGIVALGSNVITDISCRSDGTLYAYLDIQDRIGRISTSSGAAALVGTPGTTGGGNGIGFSRWDFLFLESVAGSSDSLYQVDQTTGATTAVAATTYLGFPPPSVLYRTNAMDVSPATGIMYASVNDGSGGSGPNYLATVDTTTNRVTKIGPTVPGLDGLAWRSDCDDADACTLDECARCQEVALYGSVFIGANGLSTLYRIVPGTGAAVAVGPIGFERVSAMDFDERSGLIYATGERADGSNTSVLLAIDPSTGAGTEIGPTGVAGTGFGQTLSDISFRNSDGRLYGYIEDGDGVGVIDRFTGAITALGPSGVGCCGNGIEFSRDDVLVHANDNAVNTLDQTTGAGTYVVDLSFVGFPFPNGFYRVNAMDINCSGVVYASVQDGVPGGGGGSSNFLATLDPASGVVTNVGPTVRGLDAVTFRTEHGVCHHTPVVSNPVQINNSVRLAKSPVNATITWNDPPGSYNVYKGQGGGLWAYNQTCFAQFVAGSSTPDTLNPPTFNFFFYLVSRATPCGESSLGQNSSGAQRPNNSPCP